jgi:3-methyladenine DNA glycosylase Mpg
MEVVARALLGKLLTHRREGERLTGRIIEAEAYLGLSDPASHTFTGLSSYNAVLFGPPGYADVYLIYGRYYCLNVSCLPDGEPWGSTASRSRTDQRYQNNGKTPWPATHCIGKVIDRRSRTPSPARLITAWM